MVLTEYRSRCYMYGMGYLQDGVALQHGPELAKSDGDSILIGRVGDSALGDMEVAGVVGQHTRVLVRGGRGHARRRCGRVGRAIARVSGGGW